MAIPIRDRLFLWMMVAVAALVPSVSRAEGPSLSGGRDVFTITDCAGVIVLRFLSATKPVAIRTGSVAPPPASTPPGWTVQWSVPTATDRAIGEFASTGRVVEGCPAPGLYAVPLTVLGENDSAAPLEITLVRVTEPALDVPATVSLTADRLFGPPDDVSILLRQPVLGAPDTRVAVVGGELKTMAGAATGVELDADGPVVIKAGSSARIPLQLSDILAPGSYTTRLAVSSPALAAGATIEVTYRLRIVTEVLMAMLALGILAAMLVNMILARRAALDSALVSGVRAIQSLARRATPQRDPAVRQRLLAVSNLLQVEVEAASSPEEVAALVGQAEVQAKEIETRAADAASGLMQAIAATSLLFRPGGHEPDEMIASCLRLMVEDLAALQRAADNGEVEQTSARLQDFCRELPTRALPLLQAWLTELTTELDALGALPGELRQGPAELRTAVEQAFEGRDVGAVIKAANEVALLLRRWMDGDAPFALGALWRAAARVLTLRPRLAQRLIVAAEQVEQLRRPGRDPLSRLGHAAEINRGVVAALTEAAAGKPSVLEALGRGEVVHAAAALVGETETDRFQALVPVRSAPAARALVVPSTPVAALRTKPLLPLGQDSMVMLRWVGEAPSADRVRWVCQPAEAASLVGVAAGAIVRPRQAGFLTIVLEVDQARVADVQTYAGEAAEQGVFQPRARGARWARGAITVFSALLTGFAGYQILAPAWLGTVGDLSSAFLFGFIGQFGLTRLRDIVRPLSRRL